MSGEALALVIGLYNASYIAIKIKDERWLSGCT
jgi:hypothetical protein